MSTDIWFWILFNIFIIAMLLLDIFVFHREAHVISIKESLIWSGVWVGLALLFNIIIFFTHGTEPALKFLAGYLIEKALSIDNLFIFLLIFSYFNPPPESMHKVLFWGILGAIIMRAIFIFAGISLVQSFHGILYIFGVFLIGMAVKLACQKEKEVSIEGNLVIKLFRKFVPITPNYEGDRFFVKQGSRYLATPLMLVLIVIETTDILFAIDSIPAILAITLDPFIVYTSNIFAILGLRSLYFALSGMMKFFHYLHYGLALILGFIGVKLLISGFIYIPIHFTLIFILSVLFGSVCLSYLRPQKLIPIVLFFLSLATGVPLYGEIIEEIPVSYQGRFRPFAVASKLWLYELYQRQSIKEEHLDRFRLADGKALTFVLEMHRFGHTSWDDAPLFKIDSTEIKKHLGLDTKEQHFSYHQLSEKPIDSTLLQKVSLYASLRGDANLENESLLAIIESLNMQHASPSEIANFIEMRYPLHKRLLNAGFLLKALPGKYHSGEWFSLHALSLQVYSPEKNRLVPISNFTLYTDKQFSQIQSLYQIWMRNPSKENLNALAEQLNLAYSGIAGYPYAKAIGKQLTYPSPLQLKVEALYYKYPWIWGTIILYAITVLLGIIAIRTPVDIGKWEIAALSIAFAFHTALLGIRCFILQRPPVSNMFETVIYVPWITVLVSLFFFHRPIRMAAAVASIGLLILVEITQVNSSLDNVQAVLDSQFWLIIHVLMVVGSYGTFLLSSILGHMYLTAYLRNKKETVPMSALMHAILQTLYLGVVLLISGTILGGVWAAESWGRFWDWDPKESWAFISSCIYLAWIHAYRFHKIHHFGLAIGAILGFLSISFTWYGVNYILGTGLHSYGFGTGGEVYYYAFLTAEVLFIAFATILHLKKIKRKKFKDLRHESA